MKNNPFYILKLDCIAQRKDIVSACEELGFYFDADTCATAQAVLLHPKKRLSAELDWFLGCDTHTVNDIRIAIETETIITINNLPPLALLNASLHNFTLIDHADFISVQKGILEIAHAFDTIDAEYITHNINAYRRQAKIAETSQSDINEELKKKQDRIIHCISKKIALLDIHSYIKLIGDITKKFVENERLNDNCIVIDLIQQYQINMKDAASKELTSIKNTIENLKKADESGIRDNTGKLIRKLNNWHFMTYPIQLLEQSCGTEFHENDELYHLLNQFVLWLTEETHIDRTLQVLRKAQDIFCAEEKRRNFFDFEQAILDLKQSRELYDNILEEVEAIQERFDYENEDISLEDVQSFTTSCKVQLDRSLHLLDIPNAYEDCVREIAITLRNASIYLFNEKEKLYSALVIVNTAFEFFKNIPEWRDVFKKDQEQIHSIYIRQRDTVNSWIDELRLYENKETPVKTIDDVKLFINKCSRINQIVQQIEFNPKYVDACRYLICLTTQIVISNTAKNNPNVNFLLVLMQFAVDQFEDIPSFKQQIQKYNEFINKQKNRTVVDDLKDIGRGILNFFGF